MNDKWIIYLIKCFKILFLIFMYFMSFLFFKDFITVNNIKLRITWVFFTWMFVLLIWKIRSWLRQLIRVQSLQKLSFLCSIVLNCQYCWLFFLKLAWLYRKGSSFGSISRLSHDLNFLCRIYQEEAKTQAVRFPFGI